MVKLGTAAAAMTILTLVAACSPATVESPDLFSWQLPAPDGSVFDLSSLKENRASVVVFVAPDCPLSQSHTLTLNQLAARFRADSVEFYGVVAGEWYTNEEIAEFASTYAVDFPVLVDPQYRVTDFFEARVTPEVFLIDSTGATRYAGAIDDWVGTLAQHRPITTAHYLEDALTQIVNGDDVAVGSVPALGCFIERAG